MNQSSEIELIDTIVGDPRSWWSSTERSDAPTSVDKLLNYLISYCCNPASARRCLRLFNGIDSIGDTSFSSWNEVRVSSLADIQRALEASGCTGPTWELAIIIKDFLQNMFDTLGSCDLDTDIDVKEITSYLDQLQGKPDSWEKGAAVPHRPVTSTWLRKNARKPGERILPEATLHYLKYLLGTSGYAPFDYHSEKVLTRLGLISQEQHLSVKRGIYNGLLGTNRPISKHRKLVEFSKLVCLERAPRCGICPLKAKCSFAKKIC